jgi:hypothetical protein
MNSARTTRARIRIVGALLGAGLAALWASAACSSDASNSTTKKNSDGGDCLGTCASIGSEGGGGPHFTDTAGCLDYLTSLGIDEWGRPISDPETQCGCDKCESWHIRCQNNLGCRDIAECALKVGCRTIRECFYGENWPGAQAGHGPCYDVIDKWGAYSTSAALGEAISQCSTPVCPARKTPLASVK